MEGVEFGTVYPEPGPFLSTWLLVPILVGVAVLALADWARTASKAFRTHGWVLCGGSIVIGAVVAWPLGLTVMMLDATASASVGAWAVIVTYGLVAVGATLFTMLARRTKADLLLHLAFGSASIACAAQLDVSLTSPWLLLGGGDIGGVAALLVLASWSFLWLLAILLTWILRLRLPMLQRQGS